MNRPEIRNFDPEKDKISYFKFIFILGDNVDIVDIQNGDYITDIDGKCILLRYDENDDGKRTDKAYLHEEYLKSAFGDFYEIKIKRKVNELFSKNKLNIGADSGVKISEGKNGLEFLSVLLRLGSISIFMDLGVYDTSGHENSEHPLTTLFFTEKLSEKQRKTLQTLILSMAKERYALNEVVLSRDENSFLKDKFSNRISKYPNSLVGIDENGHKILGEIYRFLKNLNPMIFKRKKGVQGNNGERDFLD